MLTKHEYVRYSIGSDTLTLKENKAELYSLYEAWHGGPKPESEYAPGEPMTYEDFKLKFFLLASQIYRLEEILSRAPGVYETEWEGYLRTGGGDSAGEKAALQKKAESDAAMIESLNRYTEALEGRDKERAERVNELERLCREHLKTIGELREHLSGVTPQNRGKV